VAAKPQIVVANKMDAVDDVERVKALERRVKKQRLPFLRISAATGEGITALLEAAWKEIAKEVRLKPDTTSEIPLKTDTTGEESIDLLGAARRNARVRRKA
jgi:50S ribosomal subunit-associated GTPase HflX